MRYFTIINFGDRSHCSERDIEKIKEIFQRAGEDVQIVKSKSVSHSEKMVELAIAEKYDAIMIGGGDGTVNSILNSIVGKPITIGLIPMGTVNSLALSLNIPLNPIKAVEEAIYNYVPRLIDIGKINGKLFGCFGSIGFDASVCHKIPLIVKIRLKKLGFVLTGLAVARGIKNLPGFKILLKPENKVYYGYSILFSNIPIYANRPLFNVTADSGNMQCYVCKTNKILDYLKLGKTAFFTPRELLNKLEGFLDSFYFKEMDIFSERPLYLQIDGEPTKLGDDKYYHIEVMEKAVSILVKTPIQS